jgi:hypothetical protein
MAQAMTRADLDGVQSWLAAVQQHQQRIIAQRGYFPDSTADIAADRRRDELASGKVGLVGGLFHAR